MNLKKYAVKTKKIEKVAGLYKFTLEHNGKEAVMYLEILEIGGFKIYKKGYFFKKLFPEMDRLLTDEYLAEVIRQYF
jgi:hypothetical protein